MIGTKRQPQRYATIHNAPMHPTVPVRWETANDRFVVVFQAQPPKAGGAPLLPDKPGDPPTPPATRDGKPRWYWHLKARNGRIVEASGQGFKRRRTAQRAAAREHPPVS